MRDMEFILRFFALSSDVYRQDKRESISLKRFLDVFMKNNANPSEEVLLSFQRRFANAVQFIHETFGTSAFHNISPSDPNKLVPKFSPTLFDSIAIAADYALRSANFAYTSDHPEESRRVLLQDKDYRFAISKETMTKSCINTRISKACKYLFGLNYE